MRAEWKDGARTRRTEVVAEGSGRYRVRVDDAEIELRVEPLSGGAMRLVSSTGVHLAEVTRAGDRRFVRLDRMDFVLERLSAARRRASAAATGDLEAPLPGVVTRVLVGAGDAVRKGQPLVAVEAMKMEHVVRAPRDGTVRSIRVRAGQMVSGGASLLDLEDGPQGG